MTFSPQDQRYMQQAIALAHHASAQGEVPVAAILVHDDKIMAQAWNQPISHCDPSAHAEMLVLRQAGRQLNNYRLLDTTLYVTLEPCMMCAAAMVHARITRLVFGAFDPKAGACGSVINILEQPFLNHHVAYQGGLLEKDCSALLTQFFQQRR